MLLKMGQHAVRTRSSRSRMIITLPRRAGRRYYVRHDAHVPLPHLSRSGAAGGPP